MNNNIEIDIVSKNEFMRRFYNLYEHSPWIIEQAYNQVANFNNITITNLHNIFKTIVLKANSVRQNKLINAHPMLVTKKSSDEQLTQLSENEQNLAGLKYLSHKDSNKFNKLNKQYFAKFGFPFIMAIKGKKKDDILEQLVVRQTNTKAKEVQNALAEINKIALFRLYEIYGL